MIRSFIMKWFDRESKVLRPENTQKAAELLFPPLEEVEMPDGSIFVVDKSLDSNLEAIYQDITDGNADDITLENLRACINNVLAVRQLLEIEVTKSDRATYLVVDKPNTNE